MSVNAEIEAFILVSVNSFMAEVNQFLVYIFSALIVFVRFWRILRVINGVIIGTKQDADARVRHLKKKVAIMKNQEFDNDSLKASLDEVMEENVRLNLLQERLEEDDGRLTVETERLEKENERLKDEFLRLTIQHAWYEHKF